MSIPDYTPTDWVDNVTPVDAARMDNLDQGLDAVNAAYNLLEARMDAEEAQPDVPTVVNGSWIKGVGGALVWTAMTIAEVSGLQAALDLKEDEINKGAVNGYAPLDGTSKVPVANLPPQGADLAFEGEWASATPYTDGDVVTYQGISYMAVAPSTNEAPVPWGASSGGGGPPLGSIVMWYAVAPPTDWLICNGVAIPGVYSELIALIGANTPDLQGRVPVGKGTNAAVDALGDSDGVAEVNRRPQHRHTPHGHTATPANGVHYALNADAAGSSNYTGGTFNLIAPNVTIGTSDGGSGNANDSLDAPAFLVLNFIIKAV